MRKKTIPLNIVMTYPVYWSRYKVFRDFIQNFYDAVGFREWQERFCYKYENDRLCMWVNGVTFSYEWLLHIGASTKTEDLSKHNAGYFGEGFKIASLCALRDFKWHIQMSSDGWTLSVTSTSQQIDQREVSMLAYDVEEKRHEEMSCLELFPITETEFELFEKVIISFYFIGNPLLGDKIWEGKEGAVYLCKTDEYTSELPYTYKYGRRGTVFCAYQLLGSNPFGLCICLHHYKQRDRERSELFNFEVIRVFQELCSFVSADGAICILEKMRRFWNSVPQAHKIDSWVPVIRLLIIRISESAVATERFRYQYPNLLCVPPLLDLVDKNRRMQARTWLKTQEKSYLLVQISFEILGYPTLEEECEKNGGFTQPDRPDDRENECMKILEEVIKIIYSDFFCFDQNMPSRKIIQNQTASYHGMARLVKKKKAIVNDKGIYIRNTVCQIYMKRIVFRREGYFDALATYIHECCHAFGGDSSQAFSLGLTLAMELLMTHFSVVEEYKKKWEDIFELKN